MLTQTRKNRRNAMTRRPRTRSAQFELLEGRTLLSVTKPILDTTGAGHTVKTAFPIPQLQLHPDKISSSFIPGKQVDAWRQQVNAGDNLAVSVQDTNGLNDRLKLKILGPNHRIVATTRFALNPSLFIQAKTTGTYTVEVIDRTPKHKQRDTVTIEVFGINKGKPLPSELLNSGKRVAWLDGNVLSLANPDGEGFQITSNWKTTVKTDPATGLPYAIFTTSGPSTIKLSGSTNDPGEQNVTIPMSGPITIQTDPGVWGSHAGTVASAVFGSPVSPAVDSNHVKAKSITSSASKVPPTLMTGLVMDWTSFFQPFETKYGLDISLSGKIFTQATGAALKTKFGDDLPVSPSETYFFYQSTQGASISFGANSASTKNAQTITVIVDPADPFVYVAGGPIAVAFSDKGLIPFKADSSSYTGPTFSANLYGKVDDLPLGDLPATVSGSMFINLDPRNTGVDYNTKGDASTLFTKNGLNTAFPNIDVGVNGTVSAGASFGGVDFSVPVGSATVGYAVTTTEQHLQLKPQYLDQAALGVPPTLPMVQQNWFTLIYRVFKFTTFTGQEYSIRVPYAVLPNSELYDVVSQPGPAAFALAGNSTDPFEGTALAGKFNVGPQFTASLQSSGNNVKDLIHNMTADFHGSANWNGYHFGTIDFSGNREHVSLNAPINVFIGRVQVAGDIHFDTGAFTASVTYAGGSADSILPFADGASNRSVTIQLQNKPDPTTLVPHLSLSAALSLDYRKGISLGKLREYGIYGALTASIGIDPSTSTYTGSVTVKGGFTIASKDVGGSASASVANNQITVGATVFHHDFGFTQKLTG